jgi:uncharacterized repeat protein (TIGR01451 family)
VKTKVTLIALTLLFTLALSGTVAAEKLDVNTTQIVGEETNLQTNNEITSDDNLGESNGTILPDPYNTRTGESFTTIQAAIDDSDTLNGDTIWVQPGTYTENVIVNKKLTIIPWPSMPGTVTINAGGTGSCFRINSGGGGSTIQGFTLTGAINPNNAGVYLNAPSCNILQNTLLNNWAGMFVWSSYNQIYENIIIDNYRHGIRLVSGSGNNNIYSNIIKNNNLDNAAGAYGGITTSAAANGNDNIYMNQIVGNHVHQIYGQAQIALNAINNWWGTNNPPSGIIGATFSPWLVLGITADPYSIYNGQTSTVTADLNHNCNLEDVSALGQVKDGIPIIFSFTGPPLGTLSINPTNTLNGIATTVFTANKVGTSHVNANLDSASVHTASNAAQTPCDIVNVPAAALELTKTVSNSSPVVHETILYTLIVQNHGPDAATLVQVTDVLPLGGLTFVGVESVDYGSYANGIWTIPSLPSNTVAQLVLRFTVDRTGTIENKATVTSLTYDPEQYLTTRTVTIQARDLPQHSTESVNAQTVGMQKTGIPIAGILLAILLVTAGLILPKRKQ